MKVTGSCHCGSIKYTAEIDPSRVMICHCMDCQHMSGTAFRTAVATSPDSMRLQGVPTEYVKVAQSGNRRIQVFCPSCGTNLYSAAEGDAHVHILRVGTLDQRAALSPSMQIWNRTALSWLSGIPGIQSCPEQELLGPPR